MPLFCFAPLSLCSEKCVCAVSKGEERLPCSSSASQILSCYGYFVQLTFHRYNEYLHTHCGVRIWGNKLSSHHTSPPNKRTSSLKSETLLPEVTFSPEGMLRLQCDLPFSLPAPQQKAEHCSSHEVRTAGRGTRALVIVRRWREGKLKKGPWWRRSEPDRTGRRTFMRTRCSPPPSLLWGVCM